MTGQLNTSLITDSAVEEEIECLDSRVTAVESDVATNKTDIKTVTDSLSDYKSSQSDVVNTNCVKSSIVDSTTVKSSNTNATCLTAVKATIETLCNTTLNGNIVNAQSVSAPTVAATNVNATCVNADSITTDEIKSTGNVVGAVGTFTTVDATNVIADSVKADTISGCVTGIVNTSNLTATNANIKCLNSTCVIGTNSNIQDASAFCAHICNADTGNLTSRHSNITEAYIDNLTVNCNLTLGDSVTIDASNLGDATADSLTTTALTVNGDETVSGKITAGAITSGGTVTGSEYCNGTKGVVIDKDSNITAADITADDITAKTINATDGTSNLDQVCITTTTTCNEFVTNLYPTNITIDKDVGDLHYSRQLDTDDTGNVLVDCKNVYPKDIVCTCCYIQSYCDKEGYLKTSDGHLNQYKRLGGICLDTYACRDCMCTAAKYKNHIRLYTCVDDTYDEKTPGCDTVFRYTKGFDIVSVDNDSTSSAPDELSVNAFGKNSTDNLLTFTYCRDDSCKNLYVSTPTTFKDTTAFLCPVSLCCVPYCSDDLSYVLTLDNNKNLVCSKAQSSLLSCDCKCIKCNCNTYLSCISQYPGDLCEYEVCCSYDNNTCCCIKANCKTMNPVYNHECIWNYYCGYGISSACYCCDYSTLTDKCTLFSCCCVNCSSNYCECQRRMNTAAHCMTDNYSYLCLYKEYCTCTPSCTSFYVDSSYFYNDLCPFTNSSPSYFYRWSYSCYNGTCTFNDKTSWLLCIYDKNLYLQTCFGGDDILRVEDGKIYTKCGEFTSGSSTAQTENTCNSWITTKCVDNTPTVDDGNITLSTRHYCTICACSTTNRCVGHSIDTNEALNTCKTVYSVLCSSSSGAVSSICSYSVTTGCLQDVKNNRLYTCANDTKCYKCGSKEFLVETANYYLDKYCPSFFVMDCNDCIKSKYYYSNTSIACFVCGGLAVKDSCTEDGVNIFVEGTDSKYSSSCILKYDYCAQCAIDVFTGSYYCECTSNTTCFCGLTFSDQYTTKNFASFGETATMQSCCCSDYCFEGVYTYSPTFCQFNIRQGCGCEYSNEYDSGAYDKRTCLTCGTCWDICYSGVDDCYTACHTDGVSFTYKNRIDATGLKESFNGLCVKTNSCSKNISDLPVTNAMVPLAGVVNNSGFAFFCKTSDGTTFYDGNFDVVDAGTCTSIYYISTVGSL